jgi:hypothetical protein
MLLFTDIYNKVEEIHQSNADEYNFIVECISIVCFPIFDLVVPMRFHACLYYQ